MKNCRKLISWILTLAMLLGLVVIPTAAAETVTLRDAGFEGSIWNDGIWSYWIDGEDWSSKQVENFLYSSDTWMNPPADGGDQCIKFYMSAAGTAYFTQVLTNAPAGTYTVSVQSMGADGETVAVKLGDMVGETVQTNSGYNNWKTSSGTFEITEDCAELIVGVQITCTAGGWGYFDNLTLTYEAPEQEEQLPVPIPLENGDFELGDATNWNLSGYSEVSTDQWAEANASYALSLWLSDSAATEGAASYSVALTAGTYFFTFDLSGAAMDSGLNYTITAGETELAKGDTTCTTTGWDAWKIHTTEQFVLTADTTVTFTLSGTQPAGYWGDLDNLKLYGTGAAAEVDPDPVPADIYVPYIKGTDGDFMRGMDVSSLYSQLNSGVKYYDDEGNVLDGQGFMNYLAACGVNWIRLRVWNDPWDDEGNGYGGGNCDVEAAKIMGAWATNAGMKVLIDFHYSDFWADPGKQQAPKAWKNLSVDEKATAVYDYTKASIEYLIANGVDVGMVQIGNETTSKVCGVSGWENMCKIFSAGAKAVRDVSADILVAIHFTNPERSGNYAYMAGQLDTYGVDYDVFASSYYPYWHGTLSNLTSVLKTVADTYGKQVIVAETSWAYTLEDGDGHDNTVRKNNNDTKNYDYSVQGQSTALTDVVKAVKAVGEKGVGVFYWESAWTPVGTPENKEANKVLWEQHGSGWASSYAGEYDPNDAGVWYGGSAWDNQAMFDFEGKPLDSVKTYLYMQTGTSGFEITVTGIEEVTQDYIVGDTLALPDTLTVSYSVGSDQELPVVWDAADVAAVNMGITGTYTVKGLVDGQYEAVATITVKPANLLVNPGFENSDMSMFYSSKTYAKRTTDDPHSGSYSLHFYNSGVADFVTDQTVVLAPGHYTFSLYGQGGSVGDAAETYAYVKIGEETLTADFALTGWKIWANPTIEFSLAEETEVTVGVNVTASQNGAWGTFDDWYLGVDMTAQHSGEFTYQVNGEDAAKHDAYHACCGAYAETTVHSGEDDNDCTTAVVCPECGTVTTEAKENHTPAEDDGDCTTDTPCIHCDCVAEEAPGHTLEHVEEDPATYEEEGNIEHYLCSVCGKYFADAEGKTEIEPEDVIIPKLEKVEEPEDPEDEPTEDEILDDEEPKDEDTEVEQPEEEPEEEEPEEEKPEVEQPEEEKPEEEQPEEDIPQTGDNLWISVVAMLSSGAALPVFKRKNKK